MSQSNPLLQEMWNRFFLNIVSVQTESYYLFHFCCFGWESSTDMSVEFEELETIGGGSLFDLRYLSHLSLNLSWVVSLPKHVLLIHSSESIPCSPRPTIIRRMRRCLQPPSLFRASSGTPFPSSMYSVAGPVSSILHQ